MLHAGWTRPTAPIGRSTRPSHRRAFSISAPHHSDCLGGLLDTCSPSRGTGYCMYRTVLSTGTLCSGVPPPCPHHHLWLHSTHCSSRRGEVRGTLHRGLFPFKQRRCSLARRAGLNDCHSIYPRMREFFTVLAAFSQWTHTFFLTPSSYAAGHTTRTVPAGITFALLSRDFNRWDHRGLPRIKDRSLLHWRSPSRTSEVSHHAVLCSPVLSPRLCSSSPSSPLALLLFLLLGRGSAEIY